jgi:membrane peptidoglycan carboxypeptidase
MTEIIVEPKRPRRKSTDIYTDRPQPDDLRTPENHYPRQNYTENNTQEDYSKDYRPEDDYEPEFGHPNEENWYPEEDTNLPEEENKPGFKNKVKRFYKKHRKKIKGFVYVSGLIGLLGLTVTGFWLLSKYNQAPSVKAQALQPPEGSVVFDRKEREIISYSGGAENREYVSLSNISENMQLAIIALEDENFYENEVGIPWKNLVGATVKCLFSRGQECRGGSGLSQQLIKNVSGQDDHSVDRKLNELMSAIKFNQEVDREEVLELYLNWVPFGRNMYGIEKASQSFYGKSAKDLTISESCYLASMPQKPTVYSLGITDIMEGNTNTPAAEELIARKNACIEKMAAVPLRGQDKPMYIQQSQVAELQAEIPDFLPPKETEIKYGHIQNYIVHEMEEKFGITQKELLTKGYKIHSTFDIDKQARMEQIITENSGTYILPNGANNAAAMVLDGPSGEIVAMIGSRDFNNVEIGGQVNVATSYRQPGSSYKPYVFAGAFERGFNPGTILLDAKTDFGGFSPSNFNKKTYGLVTARYSLQNSLNIPSVKGAYLLQNPGNQPDSISAVNNLESFASKVGVSHLRECDITMALGSCEVSMESHVTGINTLLQEGNLRTANPFKKIISREYDPSTGGLEERVFYENTQEENNPYPRIDQVIDSSIAKEVAHVMSDYDSRDPSIWGTVKSNLELDGWTGNNSVAAKTGTTSDVRDAWTVGGSPYYTVTVWVGNTDNSPMNPDATGSTSAAPIWKQIMTEIHQDKPKKGFSVEGLTPVKLSRTSGFISDSGATEYLSEEQISLLNQATEKLSGGNYNPRENSIFQNRSPITNRTIKVTAIDNKLLPNDFNLPEELITEMQCGELLSEFPQNPAWYSPAKAIGGSGNTCPTEKSDISEDKLKPEIETNLESNSPAPKTIAINVKTVNENIRVTQIDLRINGVTVETAENSPNLEVLTNSLEITGKNSVEIIIKTDFDMEVKAEFTNVNFSSANDEEEEEEEETEIDLSSFKVNCSDVELGENSTCQIVPPAKTELSVIYIFIGQSTVGSSCTLSSNSVTTCTVSTAGNEAAANLPIYITGSGTQKIEVPDSTISITDPSAGEEDEDSTGD